MRVSHGIKAPNLDFPHGPTIVEAMQILIDSVMLICLGKTDAPEPVIPEGRDDLLGGDFFVILLDSRHKRSWALQRFHTLELNDSVFLSGFIVDDNVPKAVFVAARRSSSYRDAINYKSFNIFLPSPIIHCTTDLICIVFNAMGNDIHYIDRHDRQDVWEYWSIDQ
jgi:hypothetical protein